MRKRWFVLLAVVALVAFAVPAMAEINLSGFIRSKYYAISNFERYDAGEVIPFKDGAATFPPGGEATLTSAAPLQSRISLINTESPTASYFESRGRLKFDAKGENVGAVAFFEIDVRWGDAQYVAVRNQGGGLQTDSINLETKNLYVWFKPSPALQFNVGLQNFTDTFRGILFGAADFAGITATYAAAPADFRFVWAQLKHSAAAGSLVGQDANDAVHLFVAEGHFAPTKDSRIGLDLYYIDDQAFKASYASADIYTIGVDGSIKVTPALTLSAFAFYQMGTLNEARPGFTGLATNTDIDIKGYAANVRADLAAGPGKGFLEVTYISGDDPADPDPDFEGIVTGSNYALAASFYTSTDMEILLPSIDDINSSVALTYDAANFGLGLVHVGAGYSLPLTPKLTGKLGLGYSMSVEDTGVSGTLFGDSGMAFELNAKLNYNILKGLDLTFIGAYAVLGDFYDNSALGLDDPDNLYNLYARLNYAF